jgi:TonB dependent receptor
MNYQPNGNIFLTASYSYIHTELSAPDSFYNFPAYAGTFVDGAASTIVWQGNQSSTEPGVPEHTFNLLANYQFNSGFGARLGMLVTGPMDMTSSGYINVAATNAAAAYDGLPTLLGTGGIVPLAVVAADGYYQSPRIPWQYTLNLVGYYKAGPYDIKLSVYNLTDRRNWQSSPTYYGNDFLVQSDPLSVDLSVRYKF